MAANGFPRGEREGGIEKGDQRELTERQRRHCSYLALFVYLFSLLSTDSFLFSCFFLFFLVLEVSEVNKYGGFRAHKWRDLRFQVERFTVSGGEIYGFRWRDLR